jgi:hypothetical protein
MTMDSARRLGAVVLASALLGTSACSQVTVAPRVLDPDPTFGPCDGISVAVDGRAISGTGNGGYAEPWATCVETDEPMTARAAFTAGDDVGVTLTSDAVPGTVCRVGGEPFDGLAIAKPGGGIYFETCGKTPPEFARWVVWHKPAGGDWTSDDQDITSLELAPDETVALVFTYRGEPEAPSF